MQRVTNYVIAGLFGGFFFPIARELFCTGKCDCPVTLCLKSEMGRVRAFVRSSDAPCFSAVLG